MDRRSFLVTFDEMQREFVRVLLADGFETEKATLIARTFAENTLDGVPSHGVNRFRQFVDQARQGIIQRAARPSLVHTFGAFESWDGNRGPGISNAHHCMQRAIDLARTQGIGCCVLRSTNHWMRGGTYGLQAADAGCIGICWTNAQAWMPPFGGRQSKVGNNPLVLAVPRRDGHLLLDMAMSQFSVGRIQIAARSGEKLPVAGGFDDAGTLTNDPEAIMRSRRLLPIGYWKGSGLALLLDCLAAVLADGRATYEITAEPVETGLSQVFIAIDLMQAGSDASRQQQVIDAIVADLNATKPVDPNSPVEAPGQRTFQRRASGLRDGVLIDASIWSEIQDL
jgi:3-dehydro-L-gulonate 2-dehydrogenase